MARKVKFNGTMYAVHSGSLKRVGWEYNQEESRGVLRAEFVKGAQYDYFPVSKELFTSMFSSESKGTWFAEKIKKELE